MSNTRKALLTLLALVLVKRPLDLLLSAMLPDATVNALPQVIAGAAVALLLLALPAWRMRPWSSLRLTKAKSAWKGCAAGAVAAVMCRWALAPVDAAWQGWLGLSPEALPTPESLPVAMAYVVALAVVPAMAEEAFFRGALLTGLLDGSRRATAALLTAAAFALMHGSGANLPSLLALSLLLTLLMLHTGRIAVPVTAHLVYNLTALVGRVPFWGSALCGAGLIAAAGWIILRQPEYAHPPMKKADGLIAGAALAVLAVQYFI